MTPPKPTKSRSVLAFCLLLGTLLWPGASVALTVPDVLDLLDAGIGQQVILQQMEADGSTFLLDADDLLDLKDAGASDDLIAWMIASGEGSQAASAGTAGDAYHGARSGTQASVAIYYDPFGYYWYPSPYYFSYYAPFSWFDHGFYWGASIHWNWASWGPRYHYYAYNAGYCWAPSYHHVRGAGHRDGRLWTRSDGRARHDYVVSPKTPRSRAFAARTSAGRAGATAPIRGLSTSRTLKPPREAWGLGGRGSGRLPRYGETKPSRSWGRAPAAPPPQPRGLRSPSQGKTPRSSWSRPATRPPSPKSPSAGAARRSSSKTGRGSAGSGHRTR